MAEMQIKWNKPALERVIASSDGLYSLVAEETAKRGERANGMGAGYRTRETYYKGVKKGGTAPAYSYDTQRGKKGPVGIVYTGNYAAMKDNLLHNTLAKVVR